MLVLYFVHTNLYASRCMTPIFRQFSIEELNGFDGLEMLASRIDNSSTLLRKPI